MVGRFVVRNVWLKGCVASAVVWFRKKKGKKNTRERGQLTVLSALLKESEDKQAPPTFVE